MRLENAGEAFLFEEFCLDRRRGGLFRRTSEGALTPVGVGSRALDVLQALIAHPGEVVSRDELTAAGWPGRVVEGSNLPAQIAVLRRILDAGRRLDASCIQTVPGRGYRFIAPVARHVEPHAPSETRRSEGDIGAGPYHGVPSPEPAVPVSFAKLHRRAVLTSALTGLSLVIAAVLIYANEHLLRSRPPPPMSLVVLPFDNSATDGTDHDIVERIAKDLPPFLAGSPGFQVSAGDPAAGAQLKPTDLKRLGRELGVRYAMQGDARTLDGRLRVDLDLVSTETGAHVWVDRYEVRHGDAGYGDAIPIQIVWAVNRAIIEADAARAAREEPDHPSAADLLLQARALLFRPKTLERQIELLALFRRVQQVDQNSAFAMAGEAEALLDSGVFQAEDPEYPARVRRAQELITRAEFLEPRNGKVIWARIFLLGSQDRCDELIPAVRRAIDDNPTLPLIRDGLHYRLGLCLMSGGRAADAISAFEQSIRDNPRNAQNYNRDLNIGYAQVFLGNYDEAVRWFRRSLVTNPDEGVWQRGNLLAAITSALALGGHSNEAWATAAETMRLWPTLTARSYYRANRSNPVAIEQAERLRDGLRQAGIRDHADEAADFGLPADAVLRTEYEGHTPTTAPGAHTIGTRELAIMLEQKKPLVIDAAGAWGNSLPGAVGLRGVGVGGSTTDAYQDRLGNKMQLLTRGDTAAPIVVLGWNAERFPARNVALRLVALGYTDVYWYRGGREAWEAAGQSETELIVQDW